MKKTDINIFWNQHYSLQCGMDKAKTIRGKRKAKWQLTLHSCP